MPDMHRVTVGIPEGIDRKIQALKREGPFINCSYEEEARRLLESGLAARRGRPPPEGPGQ